MMISLPRQRPRFLKGAGQGAPQRDPMGVADRVETETPAAHEPEETQAGGYIGGGGATGVSPAAHV